MNQLFELQDESSMLYWYGGIQDLLPMPKTVICKGGVLMPQGRIIISLPNCQYKNNEVVINNE